MKTFTEVSNVSGDSEAVEYICRMLLTYTYVMFTCVCVCDVCVSVCNTVYVMFMCVCVCARMCVCTLCVSLYVRARVCYVHVID